jgi:4-hydroxy-3-methylbut-2-en-1-yl diphosphate synthase IspG/GcpE
MAGTKIRLKVVKADGSVEEYLHTKVVGTINNALGTAGRADAGIAEELADAVTYFLYRDKKSSTVDSGEILSIVQAALSETGFEDAAAALNEHQFQRRLKRYRIEVADVDVQQMSDAQAICGMGSAIRRSRWDKSRIVTDLVARYRLDHQSARMIASMVEEKIFGMGISIVPASLVKQLVLADAAVILNAQQQLQTT